MERLESPVVRIMELSRPMVEVVDQPRRSPERRIYSRRTPEELAASVDGLTEIAAQEASKRHIGLWLNVEGTIFDISDSIGRISVYLNRGDDKASVALMFAKEHWRDSLMALDKGDYISAEGKIDRISTSTKST